MKSKSKHTKKRKLASELDCGASHRGDSLHSGQCHATPPPRPIDHSLKMPPEARHRQCHHQSMPVSTFVHHNFPPHRLSHCHRSSAHLPGDVSALFHRATSPSSRNFPADLNDDGLKSTSSRSHQPHQRRGHRHRPRHRVWQSLLMVTLLCAQMATVHAMLDALKALFILTGASTYLVTKYVNITNRTEGFPADGYGYFHATNATGLHNFNLSRLNELNPALNFFKGDLGNSASKPSSGLNSIRPMYVLAIEEEEDERTLPKVLLKLAISDHVGEQQSSSRANISHSIEYILDAKMDDLGPVLHNFQVNKTTGELFLIRPLDRDPPKGRAMWKFSVQARNRQTQFILAVADVLITVRDVNDNKPLFEQKVYRTTLIENGPAGQILTKVTAVDFDDADTADNGKVVYSLKSSATHAGAASVYGSRTSQSMSISDYFQIDPHSGVLTSLACCFDREKRAEYKLVARATDAGGLSDEATVVVSIGDINDCPPKFTNPSRTLILNDDSFNSFWLDQSSEQEDLSQQQSQSNRDLTASPKQSNSMNENIATFYVSDDDLPETNHLSYEIVNSTNCSLFHRFYMVANDDGSGSLLGTRAKLNSPLEYNRTYSCQLSIAVHDSVRDSPSSSGQIYEDLASLTLIYRNNTPPKRTEQTSNAAVVAMDSNDPRSTQSKPRIENGRQSPDSKMNFDENSLQVSDQSLGSSGPKAYDLTGKRVPHSECSLCQNGGQCIVTETGYRFRCYCQPGFEGALCERATHKSDIDRMLASITANELLFYGSLIVIVNLLVVVLGLMVWIVKRVRTTMTTSEQSAHPAALEANIELTPSGTIQVLQQPLMMSCTVMEPSEFKQALELDHYVIA